jgi:hypothetical protein
MDLWLVFCFKTLMEEERAPSCLSPMACPCAGIAPCHFSSACAHVILKNVQMILRFFHGSACL